VREVTLLARAFLPTGQFSALMPELQATAAAGGAPLTLTYVAMEEELDHSGDEHNTMQVRWLVTPQTGEEAPRG